MLAHRNAQATGLQRCLQFGQGFQGGQGDHHQAPRPQPRQHHLEHRLPLAAAADHHPIGIGKTAEGLRGLALLDAGRAHPQPLGIGGDQGG